MKFLDWTSVVLSLFQNFFQGISIAPMDYLREYLSWTDAKCMNPSKIFKKHEYDNFIILFDLEIKDDKEKKKQFQKWKRFI